MEKRGNIFVRGSSKKAQVTIFIIVGIIILATFLLMTMLTGKVKKETLKGEQEKIFSQAFNKEGMRIFVEDCLVDELEAGLILLGKQGRLWAGQPGGIKEFIPEESGLTVGTENIFYAITREKFPRYQEHEEAYPCNEESNPPSFCHYQYPLSGVGFGKLELRSGTVPSGALTEDLRRYLINRTISCVENFTKTNISRQAKIEQTQMEVDLKILNDGINVKVNYPLKFSVGGGEYFHLTNFDFFYPTKFKQFMDSSVIYPLLYEQKYVDFNYSEKTLQSPTFTYGSDQNYTNCLPEKNYYSCKGSLFSNQYLALGITLRKTSLASGDDLFSFSSAQVLNRPVGHSDLYEYKFLRQNRPPALDYISRFPCEMEDPEKSYDYLVIQNDPLYGELNVSASALDPDEDIINYEFGDFTASSGRALSSAAVRKENNYSVTKDKLNAMKRDFYTFQTTAADDHALNDEQKVRVLIDRPIETNLSLWMPYPGVNYFSEDINGKYYFVSKEDPVFINVSFPGASLIGFKPKINLSYNNSEKTESFNYNLAEAGKLYRPENNKLCYVFPWVGPTEDCTIENYNMEIAGQDIIQSWDYLLSTEEKFNFFKKLTDEGHLKLDFNINYCGGSFNKTNSSEANIVVKPCVPFRNPRHPWAYPYHIYAYDLKEDGTTDKTRWSKEISFNPFEAEHSCCGLDWEYYDASVPCFENPQPGCYGQIIGYTESNKGYILEKQIRLCGDSQGIVKRGNVCEGETKNEFFDLTTNDAGTKMYCGRLSGTAANPTPDPDCSNINNKCAGQLAFGLIKDVGWCSGTMGCSALCDKRNNKAIVYTGPSRQSYFFSSEFINGEAKRLFLTSTNPQPRGFYFRCGCPGGTEPYHCDSNFDGNFGGTCRGSICEGDPLS